MGGPTILQEQYPPIPGVDSADNNTFADVIGGKNDTHNGDSIYGQVKQLREDSHAVTFTYPPAADPVTLTANATAWLPGAKVVVVGNTGTLDNAAAADQGGAPNVVRIPATAHGMSVGMVPQIGGSVAYDGDHPIVAVSDANHFDIEIAYTAETFTGAETFVDVIVGDFDFHFIHISGISANGDYEIALYSGEAGSEVEIARIPSARNAVQSAEGSQDILTPLIAGETKISAAMYGGNGNADTANIKISGHCY